LFPVAWNVPSPGRGAGNGSGGPDPSARTVGAIIYRLGVGVLTAGRWPFVVPVDRPLERLPGGAFFGCSPLRDMSRFSAAGPVVVASPRPGGQPALPHWNHRAGKRCGAGPG